MPRPVALITGASAGLGAVFARKLSARGYDLILAARREDRLRALAAELNCRSEILVADLGANEGLAAVERAIAAEPRLELLVNNAGFGLMGRFWEADIAGQEQMHRLHVIATMRLAHAGLRAMVPRGRGGVINVASVAAFGQSPGTTSYSATKAWMVSFTEGLDIELRAAQSKVRVQALCPGFTVTEFHDAAGLDRKLIPGWLWLNADEVVEASLVAMLTTGKATTGKVVVIPNWKYKVVSFFLRHAPHELKRLTGRPGVRRA